ncbi:hypothetical protein V6N12_046175 [Hibiscus sabdariffa]|uniref:Uncharacterized protein n=1 Tax=Hibiscus sabdariffa TaxID=183260 RepID=A0ABR2B663_9ROSI
MLLIFSEIISPKWSDAAVLLYYYSISDEFEDIASNHGNQDDVELSSFAKRKKLAETINGVVANEKTPHLLYSLAVDVTM